MLKQNKQKTYTYSNLSKEDTEFKNIKTEGYYVNLNYISKPETEILKAGVRQKDKLNTAESKDFVFFFSYNYEKVEYNSLATPEINKAGSSKISSATGKVNCGLFAIFLLKIQIYYRSILIGVEKGISTPTLPPKTLKLVGQPLIRLLITLGAISMFICVTNKLAEFNNFLQMTILIIFILNLLFSIFSNNVRA